MHVIENHRFIFRFIQMRARINRQYGKKYIAGYKSGGDVLPGEIFL